MASVYCADPLLDVVFSLDSVITAVGMVDELAIMVTAVVLSVLFMLAFSGFGATIRRRHRTVKMLALAFLLLIGVVLVADGVGQHISKATSISRWRCSRWRSLNLRARASASRPWRCVSRDLETAASALDSWNYSLRSAALGSTRAARAAGTRHAASVTAARSTHTPAEVTGSLGATPKSSDCRYRVSANEPAEAEHDAERGEPSSLPDDQPDQTSAASRRARCARRSRACARSRCPPARRKCRRPRAAAPPSANAPNSTSASRRWLVDAATTSSIVAIFTIGCVGSIAAIVLRTRRRERGGIAGGPHDQHLLIVGEEHLPLGDVPLHRRRRVQSACDERCPPRRHVRIGASAPPTRIRLPSGLSFGPQRSASASLTSATLFAPSTAPPP